MARAKASTWFNLVAGLVVGTTANPLFVGAAPDGAAPVDPQAAGNFARPAQGNATLFAVTDAIRRGDYDAASALLQRATAESSAAAPADNWEKSEIGRLRDALTVAVQARSAGAEQIRMAEQAIQQGQEARAADLIRRVGANEPFLTGEDRQRLVQLSQKVRGQAPSATDRVPAAVTAAAPGGALATAQARAKLQLARTQMAQFNFERAEQLVHEAERLQPKLTPAEDSPKKVLDDLARVRSDPKALLTAARVALGRKDYDRAEQFAHLSEKNAGAFTFPFWSDSPAKVLKDVKDLRAQAPPPVLNSTKTPATNAAVKPAPTKPAKDASVVTASATSNTKPAATDPAKPLPGSPEATAQAVNLIKQARQALAAGDPVKAKKLNDQARVLKPNLHWWEDNPEKVQIDIARVEPKVKPAVTQTAAKTPAPATPSAPAEKNKPLTKEDAVALVKNGRTLLAENKIEEANKAYLKARSATAVSWGLFEDTPDKLRQDIEKARVKRDREESVKVLADARRLYEEGKYDDASKAAYRAQKLHGAYNIWEIGDRPERVLADIQTAKIRLAKGQPVEVKKETVKKPVEAVAQAPKPASATDQRVEDARQKLVQARVALQAGDTARAKTLAEQVKAMHVVMTAPGDDTPEAVLKDVQLAVSTRGTATVKAAPVDTNKARAEKLLADAREARKQQKLLEARQKVLEAQQVRAVFAPGEESPDAFMLSLTAEANWQVDWLIRDAVKNTGTSGPDMAQRFEIAERGLQQARSLAAGFGLDVGPVEKQLERIHNQQAVVRGETAAPVTPVAAAPKNQGQELLEKARLEIQRGEIETARKLAEQAAREEYGVQPEAFAVLRSIGAEESNQQRLQANRTFDAALAAYNRRDFRNSAILMQNIDPNCLEESRKARFREIAMTPEMRPAPVVQVQATSTAEPGLPTPPMPSGIANAATPMLGEQPGVARAADKTPGDVLLSQTQAMQQVKFQKLRQEGQEVQRDATEKFRTGQTSAAIDMLQEYLAQLNDAQLDLTQLALLRNPVDKRLQQFKLLKEQRDFLSEQTGVVQRSHDEKNREQLTEQNKQRKVAELMKQYNTCFKEGKYPQAEALAQQAHELDPDNSVVAAAISVVRQQARLKRYKDLNVEKDKVALEALVDTDNLGPSGVDDNGIVVNKEMALQARDRSKRYPLSFSATNKSDKVREIEHRLLAPVTLNFTDTPLKNVIDDLRAWQGINIFVDKDALEEEGISLDKPLTINLTQIPMKYALNLLLKEAHLTWTVRDDVLQITTSRHAKGALCTNTYQVADLVIPINDFGVFRAPNAIPQLASNDVGRSSVVPSAATPFTGPRTLFGGESAGSPNGSGSMFGTEGSASQPQMTKSGPAGTNEEKLMNLIRATVSPSSWSDSGGAGTIDYFPLTMALVINQTPDIQEQVADLLSALRRLQDQEVAVEIRFISIDDSFFERIGVNFNLNIQTKNSSIQPQLTSGVFSPDGQINAFAPKNTIVGLQPTGQLFTPDLNIPISNNTYTAAVPDFGGYQPTPGFGGLTVGLAFLSEIQVFLFLEAVQGDTRTNVMQAPKLTMFNGQTASLTVSDFQNFVTGVQVQPSPSGLLTFVPQTQQFPIGVQLTMQAVISADRRFVRMSLAPNLQSLATQSVNLFPVVLPIFPQLDGSFTGQPVLLTQYLQQPVINSVSVQTTVAVPDGGTVLMGGLKALSEERKEFGPPILSKIPYLNRLFKNTSYGRDASSLLIMVTPRIIIQEEEEEKQTGYIRPTQVPF